MNNKVTRDTPTGTKVVPRSKSAGCKLSESREWEKARYHSQKYLYLVMREDGECVCNYSGKVEHGGDFFTHSDLTLYVDPKEVASQFTDNYEIC
jgi:hypothetical protein